MSKGTGNGDEGPELQSFHNEVKRCCFCYLSREDAIKGQYFVQMQIFCPDAPFFALSCLVWPKLLD